jgi:hypothetical protein
MDAEQQGALPLFAVSLVCFELWSLCPWACLYAGSPVTRLGGRIAELFRLGVSAICGRLSDDRTVATNRDEVCTDTVLIELKYLLRYVK